MRTTVDIDDDLLAALLERYPGRSRTEAIEAALRAHLADDTVSRLRRLAGTLDIDDVSATTRAHDVAVRGGRLMSWSPSPSPAGRRRAS